MKREPYCLLMRGKEVVERFSRVLDLLEGSGKLVEALRRSWREFSTLSNVLLPVLFSFYLF